MATRHKNSRGLDNRDFFDIPTSDAREFVAQCKEVGAPVTPQDLLQLHGGTTRIFKSRAGVEGFFKRREDAEKAKKAAEEKAEREAAAAAKKAAEEKPAGGQQ